MFTRRQAIRWAEIWAACWNDRDVETILALHRDDVRFESTVARRVTGSAIVEGKDALRRYWTQLLRETGPVRLELEKVTWDPGALQIAVMYVANLEGQRTRACELLTLDTWGRVIRGRCVLLGAAHQSAATREIDELAISYQ
jgi:ketosteroid isomerase-like protein